MCCQRFHLSLDCLVMGRADEQRADRAGSFGGALPTSRVFPELAAHTSINNSPGLVSDPVYDATSLSQAEDTPAAAEPVAQPETGGTFWGSVRTFVANFVTYCNYEVRDTRRPAVRVPRCTQHC